MKEIKTKFVKSIDRYVDGYLLKVYRKAEVIADNEVIYYHTSVCAYQWDSKLLVQYWEIGKWLEIFHFNFMEELILTTRLFCSDSEILETLTLDINYDLKEIA